MLLRSLSSPKLKSWFPPWSSSKDSFPERELQVAHKQRSISLSCLDDQARKLVNQAVLELSSPKETPQPRGNKKSRTPLHPLKNVNPSKVDDQEKVESEALAVSLSSLSAIDRTFLSSGLRDEDFVGDYKCEMQTLVVGGSMGGDGGKICGGGGELGSEDPDAYYQKMIEANPGNPLLLGNYAKFLKEVKGELGKAQEYSERAILSNQGDAGVLALYADLIWENQKDTQRAESYFDQAVKAAPNDSYVMASYAKFLWEMEKLDEEDNEEQGEEEQRRHHETVPKSITPTIFHGVPHQPPLSAAM